MRDHFTDEEDVTHRENNMFVETVSRVTLQLSKPQTMLLAKLISIKARLNML